MHYVEVTITDIDEDQQDILVALLANGGYEGFVQAADTLQAYIDEPSFDEAALSTLAGDYTYTTAVIPKQNWNAVWEENFQPVIVDGFCTIRADFHNITVTTPHEIVITPKMSFGTGHHATTQLVMQMMRDTHLQNTTVLDFGTGTGVLAILAEQLGAGHVLGIDNDEWSVENAKENVERNQCTHITIQQNTTDELPGIEADVILANINRHILLQYMAQLAGHTRQGGTILMSGLLTTDHDVIVPAATVHGLQLAEQQELNNWIAMRFVKA